MTSSTTTKTASNGGSTKVQKASREYGLTVLRNAEARSLIGLAVEAAFQTNQIGHEIHSLIYDRDRTASYEQLRTLLEEALTCWQTADHYLRMLSDALEEREYSQDSLEPAF